MTIDKFVNRLYEFYKTPEGEKWKAVMADKISHCKLGLRLDNLLRCELLGLKNQWEKQDLLCGLELVSGAKFIDLEILGNLLGEHSREGE